MTLADAATQRFLATKDVVVLATLQADGAPLAMPMWFLHDPSAITMISVDGLQKVKNLRRDPRVCVVAESADANGIRGVTIQGRAEFLTDTSERRALVERLLEQGFVGAAFLLGWASFEAAGRALMVEEFRKPQTPGRLVELLAGAGYLTPTEADRLRQKCQHHDHIRACRNRGARHDLQAGSRGQCFPHRVAGFDFSHALQLRSRHSFFRANRVTIPRRAVKWRVFAVRPNFLGKHQSQRIPHAHNGGCAWSFPLPNLFDDFVPGLLVAEHGVNLWALGYNHRASSVPAGTIVASRSGPVEIIPISTCRKSETKRR